LKSSKEARAIYRIVKAARQLELGEPCPITKLMPIQQLSSQPHGEQAYKCGQFTLFLLRKSHESFLAGKSLCRKEIVPDSDKQAFYNRVLELTVPLVKQYEGELEQKAQLNELYSQIKCISPGWIRLNIHTSRRKLEDPDLVLIEQAVRYLLEGWQGAFWDYSLAQYFCCDYFHYRFIPTQKSAERFMDIADYLSFLHFDVNAAELMQITEYGT